MVRKKVDLATFAGQALQQQYLAQDLSSSGLPKREEKVQAPVNKPEPQGPPTAAPIEKNRNIRRRDKRPVAGGEDQGAVKKAKPAKEDAEVLETGLAGGETSELFVPDFECPDGHVITLGDSLGENPLLAMTLLKGLALPKDVESLESAKAKNMAELCLFLAKAGQCASKAFTDMEVLLETRKTQRGDFQAMKMEVKEANDQIEALEAKVAEAKTGLEERDLLLLKLKDAEAERDQLKEKMKKMEDELPAKLEEASDEGFNEAGDYYKEQVEALVTKAFKDGERKGFEDAHASSFLRGFQVGLDYAEVPKDDHRREDPVVLPVELPRHLIPAEQANPSAAAPPSPVEQPNPTVEENPDSPKTKPITPTEQPILKPTDDPTVV